jgi:hypothetical protein
MKKLVLTLAIAITTLSAFAGEVGVDQKVLNSFSKDFKTAREVEWTVGTNYYRADFTYNEKHVCAYYDMNGDLTALTRYVSPNDLPLTLQGSLKKSFSEYWISDLFEVSNNDGTSYYVTVENAETKLILKASDGKTWDQYKKSKKS